MDLNVWDRRGRIVIALAGAFFLCRLFGDAPNTNTHLFYVRLHTEKAKIFLSQKASYGVPSIPNMNSGPFTFPTGVDRHTSPQLPSPTTIPTAATPYDLSPTSLPLPTATPYRPQPTTRNTQPPTHAPTSRPTSTPQPTVAPSIQCPSTSTESYDSIGTSGAKISNAASDKDINLSLRGYASTNAEKALIHIDGAVDSTRPPQLAQVFAAVRAPAIVGTYRVNETNGSPIQNPEVTMIGLSATPGEVVTVPDSGYSIGSGKEVMVVYADASRVTLHYMVEDGIVRGYVIHVEDFCADPKLVQKYNELNTGGRGSLPGLPAGKKLGVAKSGELKVVIRDTGTFMDPRGKKNWWQGY